MKNIKIKSQIKNGLFKKNVTTIIKIPNKLSQNQYPNMKMKRSLSHDKSSEDKK